MRNYDRLRKLEGYLLLPAGLVHIVYLTFWADRAAAPNLYWGAMGIGMAYAILGGLILFGKIWALRPALVLNTLGFVCVIIIYDQSPLKAVDPALIAVDCVSVPLLLFLNFKAYRTLQKS